MFSCHDRPSRFELAMGCALGIVFYSLAPAAASWKERLLSEAPSKWAALEQYYSKLEVSYRKIITAPSEGKPLPLTFQGTIYCDTRQNGEMMVCTDHHVGKDGKGKQRDTTNVRGVNSRYTFTLGKTASDAESFVLINFQPVSDQARQKVRGSGGNEYDMAFKVQFVRLIDLLKDPLFTFDVHAVQRNGKELVQLEYDRQLVKQNQQGSAHKKVIGTEHGTILLDPERCWSIQEHHFENPDWKGNSFLEYGEERDGFPIIHRCKHTATHKQLGTRLTIYEFDKFIHRDIPESEFTLSAFGLPEMQVPGEQKPRTLWRWLIGIGLILGMLAVLLRIYVKKRQQPLQQV